MLVILLILGMNVLICLKILNSLILVFTLWFAKIQT